LDGGWSVCAATAGFVLASEQSVAGQLFLRVDTLADRDWPAFTVLLAPSQIKMITPLTDEQVSERKLRR
jgi:hypothetical protein